MFHLNSSVYGDFNVEKLCVGPMATQASRQPK